MSVSRVITLFFRFVRNPQPYCDVLPYRFFGNMMVIRLYRKFILPVLVWRLKNKRRINVLFLAMNPDMWRYDEVYRKLAKDDRFNPVIVTAMRNIPNMVVRLQEQEAMVAYFLAKGYNVVRGFDLVRNRWINLKKLKPDIIFYTQPYDRGIERSFEFFHHLSALHCYTPYSFQLSETGWGWNNNLQQYCWKLFYVGDVHLKVCERLSRIGSQNVVLAGYCLDEEYRVEYANKISVSNAAWKNDCRKRVIWAPHHSITEKEGFKVSSFLEIADFMLRLRNEYKEKVLFAFKPHPILKIKLYDIWGRTKTDVYYEDWARSEASFDAQGDYLALFAGSDAMIHCSGSFIVEYMYTGKPVAYVYSQSRNPPDIGPIGDAALGAHYHLHSETEIRSFIDDVVLGGHDTMIGIRKSVADKYLRSPNGKMFSDNVYETILEGLGKKCQTR